MFVSPQRSSRGFSATLLAFQTCFVEVALSSSNLHFGDSLSSVIRLAIKDRQMTVVRGLVLQSSIPCFPNLVDRILSSHRGFISWGSSSDCESSHHQSMFRTHNTDLLADNPSDVSKSAHCVKALSFDSVLGRRRKAAAEQEWTLPKPRLG